MGTTILAAPPTTTPLVSSTRYIDGFWADWLIRSLVNGVQNAPQSVTPGPELVNQSASVGVTPFNLGSIVAGRYRMSWTARVTTAASVSSSLTVTVSYTRKGVSCTQTSGAMTSNATGQPASGVFLINSDGGSPISYSTTYASTGAPVMVYELDATIESVS